MNHQEKVMVGVRVRKDIWEAFTRYVSENGYKTGDELSKAIEMYLKHKNALMKKEAMDNEIDMIKKKILEKVEPGGSLPRNMLENIIFSVSNVMDPRSAESRIKKLLASGFLKKEVTGDIYIVCDAAQTEQLPP